MNRLSCGGEQARLLGKRLAAMVTYLSAHHMHDHAADRLKDVLKNAARMAGTQVYVADGPNDITTPAGVRKPDAFIVPRDVARTAISGKVRTYYALTQGHWASRPPGPSATGPPRGRPTALPRPCMTSA